MHCGLFKRLCTEERQIRGFSFVFLECFVTSVQMQTSVQWGEKEA